MKFLIIDDDAAERSRTIQALCGKFADVDMIEIGSPDVFNSIIAQADFDLVITEFRLGWTNGLSLFKELHKRYACIPVIMLTAFGNETVAVTAIKNGMDDYLTKSNRHLLADAIEQSLLNPDKRSPCKDEDNNILLCEKWDLAISRLTSDFAYSMRILPDNKPVFEWLTEPLKRMLNKPAEPHHAGLLAIHPDDAEIVEYRFEQLLAGFENTAEYRIITGDGHCRYFSDHALPIRDWANGKVIRIYGAIQDITEQRKIEDTLRLMQRAIDSSSNGIVITGLVDTDYAIIYANDAFLRLTGYALDELLGHNCRILQNNDRNQPEIEQLRTALTENCDSHTVLRNYRKDGSLFWNEVFISPIRDKQNKITHYVGVQNDVTYRCEMQALLSKNEAKLRAILNNVFDGIIIIDEHGLIECLNPSTETIFGYREDELIGRSINCLVPESDRSRYHSYLSHYLAGGNTKASGIGRETDGLRKDGSTFPMDLNISAVNVDDRHLFIGTVHDVSKHKQNEDALRELSSHQELIREEERTRIAREIHDELGSFLTALKMDLSWLAKQLPTALSTCREKTQVMTQHVDDAIQTVRKIMTDLRPSILDHLGLLAAIDWHIEEFREQTGIECTLTLPEDPVEIDEKRSTAVFRIMQEALTNIVLHAIATWASIDISVSDGVLLMRIADNGCGMTPAQMNKSGRYGIQGMHERARYFGGELTLDCRPGQGTLLSLRMPLQSSNRAGTCDD